MADLIRKNVKARARAQFQQRFRINNLLFETARKLFANCFAETVL